MSMVTGPIYNVIKVGSRFHLIHIEKNEIYYNYWLTREEAEKICDKKNDEAWPEYSRKKRKDERKRAARY